MKDENRRMKDEGRAAMALFAV
ncbi:MAG: hypothetical protein QOE82_1571, partial [Thermoanaerobaculia bacterium]|nr:hypothetical protein [Thermoanaerobaculia bacterium]